MCLLVRKKGTMMRLALTTLAETAKEGAPRETAKLVKQLLDLLESKYGNEYNIQLSVIQTHALGLLLGYLCKEVGVNSIEMLPTMMLGEHLASLDIALVKCVFDNIQGNS